MRTPPVAAILALVLCVLPRPASAEWPALGRAVSTAPGRQDGPKVAGDGAGGAIIVWHDTRSTRVNVFARRVLASGELDPAWPIDGRALLGDSTALAGAHGGQQAPVIVPDGTGGAIVAWQDDRNLASGPDIVAQHVLASGVVDPAWPANGRPLCTAAGRQDFPQIVADGAGGAIVTWMDARSAATDIDIFAQHILASGAVDPGWPRDGVALSRAPDAQALPRIASDGAGGAIVTWHDFRSSSTTSVDIFAQHVLASGVVDPAWPANGRALCTADGAQDLPQIVADGAGGAVVTWEDYRDGTSHIFAQRVLGSGAIAPGWPADGRAVCTAAVGQINPVITSDRAHGALIAWEDLRGGGNRSIFAQHVLATGEVDPVWPADGRALSLAFGDATNPTLVGDGSGGAIVGWQEDFFVKVHHVRGSGVLDPTFPESGTFVRLNLDFQLSADLVPAGTGKGIVAWANGASGPDTDIYAMLVVTEGAVAVDPPPLAGGIAFVRLGSNPSRGPIALRFTLPQDATMRLAIYDVGGRLVRELESGTRPAGAHDVAWDLRDDGGQAVGGGLYFARFQTDGRTLITKIATLR